MGGEKLQLPSKHHKYRRQTEISDGTGSDGDAYVQAGAAYSEPVSNEKNPIHYQITHDDPKFTKLTLHPLTSQFREFARLTPPSDDESQADDSNLRKERKATLSKDEEPEDNIPRISLFGIEAWFNQAKIFSTPLCKVTVYDVRSTFWRAQKPGLTYKEFDNFIEDLAEFRNIHPDTIVFRLRLSGSPELEARLSHLTVPEGTVDRVVDAFRLDAENLNEDFINLSKTPYEEPICYGGIRSTARRNKSVKEEQKNLRAQAKALMIQGEDTEQMDKLKENFISFAKNGNYYSDGRTMQVTQLIKWFKQAGIIDGNISSSDVGFLFKKLYILTGHIYFDDLNHFLRDLSAWKEVPKKKLIQKLRVCEPPASSSITIVSMKLPESMFNVLKSALEDYAEDYEENRDAYEETSADGPTGHTPNSRNLHFRNRIEANQVHVHSVFLDSVKKKNPDELDNPMMMTKKKNSGRPADTDDKDDAFSEEKRGGKETMTKRWNDAYPMGGTETGHRARIEQDLERLMFGEYPLENDSSDDEERVKKKIKGKYDVASSSVLNQHPAVPLDEQFEKFKKYGPSANEDGITLKNIELWFNLAGMVLHGNSLFTSQKITDTFKSFKFAQEHEYLDYDTFLAFLETLASSTSKKNKTNVKELRERLSRCGPPKPPVDEPKKREESHKTEKPTPPVNTERRSSMKLEKEKEEEDGYGPAFKNRFQEFARFGEPTAETTVQFPHGLSMLNADKWFRQAKLLKVVINTGDVDVMYKQLYPTKQRINIHEFVKLVQALKEASLNAKVTFEEMMEALANAGAPEIHEIKLSKSQPPSQTPSRAPSRMRQESL